MKAQMVDDILETIRLHNEHRWYDWSEEDYFLKLCKRINGKKIEIIFIKGYAYAKLDQNFPLPSYCWKALDKGKSV